MDFTPIAGLIRNLVEYNNRNQVRLPTNATDVNRDGTVDILDILLVAAHFSGSNFVEDTASENIYPDVNGDGVVDIQDMVLVADAIAE